MTLVSKINGDSSNDYVDVVAITGQGSENLGNLAATNLANGDGMENSAVIGNYTPAQNVLSQEEFEILVLDTSDSAIVSGFRSWLGDLEDQGKYRMMFTGSTTGLTASAAVLAATGMNNAQVGYVYPGVKQDDLAEIEQTYPGYLAAAKVAGIIAGLDLESSPTYKTVTDINDLESRPSNSDIQDLLAGNVIPLVWNGRRFRIERGITTLNDNDSYFKKIKIVRTLNNIANALNFAMDEDIIGEINNDEDGRNGCNKT